MFDSKVTPFLPVLDTNLLNCLLKVREKDCVQTWVMATREKGIFILLNGNIVVKLFIIGYKVAY